jgi:biopolymer transport protein ExbD
MNLGQRNSVSAGNNMSSMTDLVFLLLIFFIILSTLVSNGVNVDLPDSKGVTTSGQNVTVSIDKDINYFIGSDPVAKDGLELRLRAMFASRSDSTLYLKVDETVPTGETISVIGMAKENQWKVMVGANRINE